MHWVYACIVYALSVEVSHEQRLVAGHPSRSARSWRILLVGKEGTALRSDWYTARGRKHRRIRRPKNGKNDTEMSKMVI